MAHAQHTHAHFDNAVYETQTAGAQRSDSWEALQAQVRAVEVTSCFIFAHRELDTVTTVALSQYLRYECPAKFVDLSCLGNWKAASSELATAAECGLRTARSLVLDGNDIGGDLAVLEPWCIAFEQHPGLQHVSLRDACIDDRALQRLAEVLRRNSLLFSIDIGFNRISDAGVEALINAIQDNPVILEVVLDGCDVCNDTQARLSAALQRNCERFPNAHGCIAGLRSLRQARAEATTSMSIRTCNLHDAKRSTRDPDQCNKQFPEEPAEVTSALLAMFASMEPGEITFVPDNEANANDGDDIFFDAGSGPTVELNNRCDAGWRYTAADREVLCEMRRTTTDIKACRKHERARGDEAHKRIVSNQLSFNEKWSPTEQRIYQLKEELADVVELTRYAIEENIKVKMAVPAAQAELEETRRDQFSFHLGLQQLENSLMLQNHEAQEQVERLKAELFNLEESDNRLAEDNERCRRLLHAARFETETERFLPRAAREQAVAQKAAEEEAKARADAEIAKRLGGVPPPAGPLCFLPP